MSSLNDFEVSKNFNLREFVSPDTNEVKLENEVVFRLQKLRDKIGKPITVTSGYRTHEYNNYVGGVPKSYHKLGQAADIYCSGVSTKNLAKLAKEVGFRGIGTYINSGFVHVDVGPTRSWTG